MTFGGGIEAQGKPFEGYVTSQLPKETIDLNKIKPSFNVFDNFNGATGEAISVKTLDTTASSYQNPSKIAGQLRKYVNDTLNFEIDSGAGFVLRKDMINSRTIQLGIPGETSAAQWAAIVREAAEAQILGVKVIVTKVF
jgi:filamentous hemagglutinin